MKNLARAVALVLVLGMAPAARAGLTFNFNPAGGTDQRAIDGFAAAGALWSNVFSDNITVNINIAFTGLPAGVLGSTNASQSNYTYTNVRNALIADKTSADDTTATANLQSGPGVAMLINRTSDSPNGSGSATPYLDNNNDSNNTTIHMTSANAKALGLLSANNAAIDASITFSSNFTFDFNRADGIDSNSFDFIGIAAHEIGHTLGFISGVDILDGNPGFASNQYTFVSTLDLFRYSDDSVAKGPGVIDFTADDRTKFFSINGGATNAGATFSTGIKFGDGRQASHWKDNLGLGIMDPTAAPGELLQITGNDLRAFDVIGYNLSVPEPASIAMTAFGLFGAACYARSRKKVA